MPHPVVFIAELSLLTHFNMQRNIEKFGIKFLDTIHQYCVDISKYRSMTNAITISHCEDYSMSLVSLSKEDLYRPTCYQ